MCTEVTFLSRLHIGITQNEVNTLLVSRSHVRYVSITQDKRVCVCVWSVEVIMFSHPHLLSAAAAGWPGVAGAVSGQWESAWWLGRSLRRGETWKSGGWRKKNQETYREWCKVKHTGITCIIKGSLMLCFKAWPYSYISAHSLTPIQPLKAPCLAKFP